MTSEEKKPDSSIPHEKQLLIKELIAKGERNLKIAEILESDDFLEMSCFPKEHLCSVIINRLYYGVYLIGKSKLLEKDKAIKEGERIGHVGYYPNKNKTNGKTEEKKSLWTELRKHYPKARSLCLKAKNLFDMRNEYDYNVDKKKEEVEIDLKNCKKRAKGLAEKLRRLQ